MSNTIHKKLQTQITLNQPFPNKIAKKHIAGVA